MDTLPPISPEIPKSPRLQPLNEVLPDHSPLQLPQQDPVGAVSQGFSELAVSPATGLSVMLSTEATATSSECAKDITTPLQMESEAVHITLPSVDTIQQPSFQGSTRPQSTTTTNNIPQTTTSWNNDELLSLDGKVCPMYTTVADKLATLINEEKMDGDLITGRDALTKTSSIEQHNTDASMSQAYYPTELTAEEGIRRVTKLGLGQHTQRILNKPQQPPQSQPGPPTHLYPQVQMNDNSSDTGTMSSGLASSRADSIDDDVLIDPYRAEISQATPHYGSSSSGSKSPVNVKCEPSSNQDYQMLGVRDEGIPFNQDHLHMPNKTPPLPTQQHQSAPRYGGSLFVSNDEVAVKHEPSSVKDFQMTGVPDEGLPFNQVRIHMESSSTLQSNQATPYGGSLISSNDPIPMQCKQSRGEDCQMTSIPDDGIPFNQERLRMLQRTPSPPFEPPPDQILKRSSTSENAIPLAFNRLTGQVFSTPKTQIKMENQERPSNNQQSVDTGFHRDRLQMLAWPSSESGPSGSVSSQSSPVRVQGTFPHPLGPSTPTAALNTLPPPVTDHKKKQRGKKRSPRQILFEDCRSPSDDHVTRRLSLSQVGSQKRQRSEDGDDHSRSPCVYRDFEEARSRGLFHDHDDVPRPRMTGVSPFDSEEYPITKAPDPYFFDPADIDGLFREVKQMTSKKSYSNPPQHGLQSNTGVPQTPSSGAMTRPNTPSSHRDERSGAKQSAFGSFVPSQPKKRRLENYDGTLAPFLDLGYDPQVTAISTMLLDVYAWVGEQYFQTLLVELVTEMSFGAGTGDQKNYMNYMQGRRPIQAFTDCYPRLLRIWSHVSISSDKVVKLHIGAYVERYRNSIGVLCEKNAIELKRWFNCVMGKEFKEFLEREKVIRDQEREKARGMTPLGRSHRLTPPMWQRGNGDTNMGGGSGWQW
ncbi:hypothetical protein BZA77DRAFT_353956 [Pyronema omphalodes]|nr:hypothetical protein BZA77DRAFT_353956 [Pyronema omphalodes]